ncbi:MAG: hypothetical protein H0X33_11790 [Taibaiella sp.]|nr:hypothetical protein [Taibaiella sp.]
MVNFNQANVDAFITDVKSKPLSVRQPIATAISSDLKGFIRDNFVLDAVYDFSITNLDDSIAQEWGNGISLAILNDNWTLAVTFPPTPPAPAMCKETSETVSGSYNSSTGGYTVTKGVSWKY